MLSNYLMVTTAKNEAKTLSKTIKTVAQQILKPKIWLIFDDNSTDNTLEVIKNASDQFSFIHYRSLGDFTFNEPWRYDAIMAHGFKLIADLAKKIEWEYIAVLDADIMLNDDNYFFDVIQFMNTNKKVGIACGRIDDMIGSKIITKKKPVNKPAGAARVISKKCLTSIGGYIVGPSSDTIMNNVANHRTKSSIQKLF